MPEKKGEMSMGSKLRRRICSLFGVLLILGTVILPGIAATAAETDNELEATRQEVKELKQTVDRLASEVERLKQDRQQGLLFNEAEQLDKIDRSIDEKNDEIARRKRHH